MKTSRTLDAPIGDGWVRLVQCANGDQMLWAHKATPIDHMGQFTSPPITGDVIGGLKELIYAYENPLPIAEGTADIEDDQNP